MLALYEKPNEIHAELAEAPNLISKEPLLPISLIPLTEEDQVKILFVLWLLFRNSFLFFLAISF